MTAVTIAPAALVRDGHAALHLAMEGPVYASPAVGWAAVDLQEALDLSDALRRRTVHWECVWPHLSNEADPDEAASLKAAEEVESATGDLIAAMAALGGAEDMKNVTTGVES